MDGNKSFTSMKRIAAHGHIRHVTLLLSILILIIPNGCAANKNTKETTRVTLQALCMDRPLHPRCRGTVLKRAAPNHNWDLLFDDYLRSKLSRTSLEDYASDGRWNMQNKLTNKERNDMYEYNQPTQRIRNNKLKLLDRLLQIRQMGETDSTGRYARHINSQNANAFDNAPDFSQYTPENEYK